MTIKLDHILKKKSIRYHSPVNHLIFHVSFGKTFRVSGYSVVYVALLAVGPSKHPVEYIDI